jgi:hypothetical protein
MIDFLDPYWILIGTVLGFGIGYIFAKGKLSVRTKK